MKTYGKHATTKKPVAGSTGPATSAGAEMSQEGYLEYLQQRLGAIEQQLKLGGDPQTHAHALADGPGGPCRVHGDNGLYRTNWFDGRYLTAAALSADQQFLDVRARLVAQTQHAGIAWGLGLRLHDGFAHALQPRDRYTDAEVADERKKMAKDTGGARALPRGPRWGVAPGPCAGPTVGDARLVLDPGVGFDGIGRPIAVDRPFTFRFSDLVRDFTRRPTVAVAGSGTSFMPCVCVQPLPGGDAGAAFEPGPYLVVICPSEQGEGGAAVHQDVCASSAAGMHCEADGWRGGFCLSLAKLPAPWGAAAADTSFGLRSSLAGWFFETWEHDLRQRWEPPFPALACGGLGPLARQPGCIALGLVFVGNSDDLVFLDSWIPRRYQVSSASAAWAANLRGAPAPAAVLARQQWFQCQLAEALAYYRTHPDCVAPAPRETIPERDAAGSAARRFEKKTGRLERPQGPNLHQLGFRTIPPYGFLPIDGSVLPSALEAFLIASKAGGVDALFSETLITRMAAESAKTYFRGTNVITMSKVALHDDDVLEDIVDAQDKDMIPLRLVPNASWDAIKAILDPYRLLFPGLDDDDGKGEGGGASPFAGVLQALIRGERVTVEKLINREISVVKLFVLMKGLRRAFPLVGTAGDPKDDLQLQLMALLQQQTGMDNANNPTTGSPREGKALDFIEQVGLDFFGGSARPRPVVLYAKKRLVMPAFVYALLDAILDLLDLVGRLYGNDQQKQKLADVTPAQPAPAQPAPIQPAQPANRAGTDVGSAVSDSLSTRTQRTGDLFIPARMLATLAQPLQAAAKPLMATLRQPVTRALVVEGARVLAPDLALPGTFTTYRTLKETRLRENRALGVPAAEAERLAEADATDAMLDEHPGFALVKIAHGLMPARERRSLVRDFEARARRDHPAKSDLGIVAGKTFTRNAAKLKSDDERELYAVARDAFGKRSLNELVEVGEAMPSDTRLDAVLAADSGAVTAMIGEKPAEKVLKVVAEDSASLADAVTAIVSTPRAKDQAFWAKVDAATAANGGDAGVALAKVAEDPAEKVAATQLLTVNRALGRDGFAVFAGRVRTLGR